MFSDDKVLCNERKYMETCSRFMGVAVMQKLGLELSLNLDRILNELIETSEMHACYVNDGIVQIPIVKNNIIKEIVVDAYKLIQDSSSSVSRIIMASLTYSSLKKMMISVSDDAILKRLVDIVMSRIILAEGNKLLKMIQEKYDELDANVSSLKESNDNLKKSNDKFSSINDELEKLVAKLGVIMSKECLASNEKNISTSCKI
jgi:hypothetical protein